MLAQVISIVRRVKDVGVVQLARLVELLNQVLDEIIHSLESTQPAALERINVVNDRLVQLGDVINPAGRALNQRVEALIPRNLMVLEQVSMTRRILRLPEPSRIARRAVRAI